VNGYETNDQVIAGLDVGSSQVTTVLGRKTQDGVEILGMGECPTEGMRRGAVVNVDATVKSIRQSVTEGGTDDRADRRFGLRRISGPLIKSFNSHAAISVKNEHEVTDADFTRVLEIARTVELPNDREILHVLTQEFIVDDMAGIRDPRGMTGIRLDARVHVVTNDVPGRETWRDAWRRRTSTSKASSSPPSLRPRRCSPRRSARSAWR